MATSLMDTTGRRDTHGAARAVGRDLPRVAEARAPVRAAAERIFFFRFRFSVRVGLAGRLVLERLIQRIPVREFRRALDPLFQHIPTNTFTG